MRVMFLSCLLPLLIQDPEDLSKSAWQKVQSGDYKGAAEDLTRAIDAGGKSAYPCYLRGYCRFTLGDYNGSAADVTDAIELGDRRVETYSLRGQARYFAGDSRGAVADLSEGPEEPKDPHLLGLRGGAYFESLRRADDDAKIDRILREELEAVRQL